MLLLRKRTGQRVARGGSEFHAWMNMLHLQQISFSASEEETVNLESDGFKRNAKNV